MSDFTHLDKQGNVSMVDVSAKPIQQREAVARGEIHLQRDTIKKIQGNEIAKGNVLATARLAGIMAAKKTGELIPLCHPLGISHCEVNFNVRDDRIEITATTRVAAQTGVEMEALAAVSMAALTIYDMCKAIDKSMRIEGIHLVSKTKK
ncbi:MAG TPA: cyclic pyranopterin monophosphate synthase MoaC [Verrucomicrobiae bacterium]|nr:cyclic pyranopterin monophosphate synthase MoaC [Verrucomicrobiae bacterium]